MLFLFLTVLVLEERTLGVGTLHDGVFRCNYCNITDIENDVLVDIPQNVTRINLDNMITEVGFAFWEFDNCTEISLARNSLSELSIYSFAVKLRSTEKLVLSENRITVFSPLSSYNTPLRELYLDNNKLTHLETHVFVDFTNLEILRLDQNLIQSADFSAFYTQTKLKELHLQGNRLQVIHRGFFKYFNNLRQLMLQENQINFIERDSFENLAKLVTLDLSQNNLTRFRSGVVDEEQVDSSENIASVEAGAFSGLVSVKHLRLNFNKLEKIPDGMFDGLNSTDDLAFYLANNSLVIIPCAPLAEIPRHFVLDISGNPLNCDRRLCWLKQEVEFGTIKWLNETEENQRLSVGHVYTPSCADGTIWNHITWDCDEGRNLNSCLTLILSFRPS